MSAASGDTNVSFINLNLEFWKTKEPEDILEAINVRSKQIYENKKLFKSGDAQTNIRIAFTIQRLKSEIKVLQSLLPELGVVIDNTK